MQTLLNTMSGSLGSVQQYFFINHPNETRYNDLSSGEYFRLSLFRQNQLNFFFQDNWRMTDDLTLNLGMRYEYYGVPYMGNGMTAGIKGGALNTFSLSGRSWQGWMKSGWDPLSNQPKEANYRNCDAANSDAAGNCKPAEVAFIGPDSPNPSQQAYNDDYNNFGPVIGFSYSLPWGGKGKTVLRGGYQLNYLTLGRANTAAYNMPGLEQSYSFTGNGAYMDLSMLRTLSPLVLPSTLVPPIANPVIPIGARVSAPTVYDPNLRTPYTQSLNLMLSRTIGSSLTLDVRYVGNLSRKQTTTINLNAPNYFSNGLMDAFVQARAGGNPVLLDKVLAGTNIAGATTTYGPVGTTKGTTYQSGALHLRTNTTTRPLLANGDFASLASSLATMDLTAAWNPGITSFIDSAKTGEVLRAAGMPENFIQASPQFSSVSYTGNFNHSNYHSMQTQLTMRPTHGLGLSATYTWSRQLGSLGYTDYGNRAADYGLSGGRAHAFTSYGTFDLPFGPNRMLFSGFSPNIVGRIIGGWQLSWIHTMQSGQPMSVTGRNALWGGAQPDKVGPFNNKSGYVTWLPNASLGNYFNNKYTYTGTLSADQTAKYPTLLTKDPQCLNPTIVDPGLQSGCTLVALVDAADRAKGINTVIFQNSMPGVRGNFDRNQLTSFGSWNTDAALSKSVRLTEGKSISLRIDATNVFNHVQATSGFSLSAGSRTAPGLFYTGTLPLSVTASTTPFGNLDSKSGVRTFKARVRIDF